MQSIQLPKHHYSITSVENVISICQPFFKVSSTNGFLYGRFFDNGFAFFLTTHREYYLYYLAKNYRMTPFPIPCVVPRKFFYLTNQHQAEPFNQIYCDTFNCFKLDNIIFLIERHFNYYEMYAFSSAPNNTNVLNFYINHIDIFEKFKFYFRDRAAKILKDSAQHTVLIPEHLRSPLRGLTAVEVKDYSPAMAVSTDLTINRYYLDDNYAGITLSQRELKLLNYIKAGHTFKEIAHLMHLSPRTIEDYVDNLKSKLKVQKKSELLLTAQQLGLLSFNCD